MPRIRHWRLLSAGLIAAALSETAAQAQEIPMAPVPPSGGTTAAPPTPGGFVPPADSPASCSCGDRHGLNRWWWHHNQCKRHVQEHFLGYAEEFNEWPLGWALYAHGRTQVANGVAARMVFYHYDFIDGTSQLNVRGRDKLTKIAALLPGTFFPVVIERTPEEPGLDQARRLALLAEFCRGAFPVPAERVVIGPPIAGGLSGQEAILVYANRLNQVLTGGAAAGVGGAGGGFSGVGQNFDASGLSGAAVIPGR